MAPGNRGHDVMFIMKVSLRKTLCLIGLCSAIPLRAITVQETTGHTESGKCIGSMERLENEELTIRADQTISKEERLQRLTEIWKKQRDLMEEANKAKVSTQTKTNTTQSTKIVDNNASVKNTRGESLSSKTVNPITATQADNLISESKAIISILHQRMYIFLGDKRFREYSISTSKFGVGDEFGSYKTPTGLFRVYSKIGSGLNPGTVLKSRQPTHEVVAPNAKDRDPIVTRIIWLEGLEPSNRHALERCIYIHGTPQEQELGRPASYGCVRMASKDVVMVYEMLPEQSRVAILDRLDKGTLKKLRYVEERKRS
jgi:lipoprotein-anchoring transpeptidase ErfK/SrfK